MLPKCLLSVINNYKTQMEQLEEFKVKFFKGLLSDLFFVGTYDSWHRFPLDVRVWSLESSTAVGQMGAHMRDEIWRKKQNIAKVRSWYYH